MAWAVNGTALEMTEKDFGVNQPLILGGPTFAADDDVKLSIFKLNASEALIEKSFTNIQNNTVNIQISESDSDKLKPGSYEYNLDWYNGDSFMDNLIRRATFKVVGK